MAVITDLLFARAAERGQAPALVDDGGTITWEDLAERVRRTASLLRAEGIGKRDPVVLMIANRPAYVIVWLALANIGAIAVSVNTALVGEGLRYAIAASRAVALVGERALLEATSADIAPVLEGRSVIAFAHEDELAAMAAAQAPDPPYDGEGGDPFSIIYTSGTTGPPKGVLNCHQAFIASGRQMADLLDVGPDDRIMVFLPLFHVNPQMYAVMSALVTGCALVIRPKFSASAFFDDARRFGATMFTYVGTVLAMLANRHRGEMRDHSIVRCVGGGCPPAVWRAVEERFGVRPLELYGMTEIGGWVTGNRAGATRFATCGRARPDVEVAVFGPDDRPVASGMQGEIVVRPREPDVLLLGYWDNAQASWDAVRNMWFHTGDSGSLDADGYLAFHGRMREIIRRGGENISPFEIETALLDHPAIADAAVVAVPDPIYGQEIKAAVVRAGALDPGEVRAFLDGRVAPFMLPRYIQFVDTIPRTQTQKIQRAALSEDSVGVVDLVPETRNA